MNSTMERQFLTYLKIPIHERTDEDLAVIYAFLQSLEGLSNLRGNALRAICRTLRYEHHQANDLLYRRGDVNTCWYILLTGSVFIDNSMYLPRSSFGKRTGGATRRPNDCLILEPSDMIVIDYPDVPLMRPTPRVGAPVVRAIQRQSASCATAMSLEGYGDLYRNNNHLHLNHHNNHHQQQQQQHQQQQQQQHQHQQQHQQQQQQLHHHSSAYQSMMPERQDQYQFPLQVPGRVETSGATYMPHQEAHYPHPHVKRNSRASDTSSAYSGSDLMQSSLDDTGLEQDYGQMTMESLADSDDDENYSESNDSYCVRDTVRDCLEKDPSERTDDDLETLLDFMQHFPAFMNMTLATRREFCAVMVFAVVEKAGTIVMNDGEELDSWSVILNGCVEIERPDGNIEELHMGDCFGITPTMEKLYHKGIMRTMVDDCQFVCIAQADYFSILHHGEERTVRHEEEGLVTLVTEKRELDGGNRKGQMVIRGTTDRLTTHLVEEHSSVDPSYVEDFLLTYRTFLKSPLEVANKLLMWFNDPQLRDRVTRVVLLWVNNHFNDFETDAQLNEFLEKFEKLLEREHMSGQMRLLSIACAAKARPRTVVLTRSTKDEILHFSILGGLERDCPIFISKVERGSKAHEAGLKRGDQILEVNGTNFEQITHSRALEILRGTTHLSITARSNLLGSRFLAPFAYRDSCMSADPLSTRPTKQQTSTGGKFIPERQRLSVPELEGVQPVIQAHKEKKNKDSKGINQTHKTKIRKALIRMNILPKGSQNDNLHSTEDLYSTSSRSSTTSSSSLTAGTLGSHLSASNPDLSSIYSDEGKYDFPEHVLRVYRADQTCKYFLVHKETTAREVVMLAIREFGISDPSSNYSLCEVSVVSENMIKQKRLPDQLGNLPERISLNGRYYLKNNMITETLVPDDLAPELYKESQITFLQLNSTEIAAQMTLDDFKVFQDIEPTEYVDELFNLKSKYGTQKLQQFAELVNKEMFWVVTEILIEPILIKRMRVIKHFVKIAKHSKDCKNFNSMFAIISGLGHATVSRLRQTWDKLPSKYIKMFTDMQDMMDPSRNMSKYRNVINSDRVQPPMLPFYPVVKKDMTFIHLGNDSSVDGLINFEKLRMIAKEVKHICNMSSAKYDAGTMFFGSSIPATTFAMFAQSSTIYSGVATMRRKARRGSALPNPKKMYEEAQMVRRVKTYLNTLEIIYDEEKLKIMSHQCEAPNNMNTLRKRDPSPTQSTNSYEDKQRPTYTGPKFGTSSPDAVRKMMALSDKSRPVNPKYASHLHTSSPKAARPHASPKHQHSAGTLGMGTRPPPLQPAVNLSSESSSVVSLTGLVRKSRTSDSLSTGATPSPTSNATFQQQLELDSGHNSVASSSYDARSMSSVGSGSSPVSQRKISPQSAFSHYIHQQYTNQGTTTTTATTKAVPPPVAKRPPLPDYYAATRRKQMSDRGRAHSLEGAMSPYYPGYEGQEQRRENSLDEESEQVSAV